MKRSPLLRPTNTTMWLCRAAGWWALLPPAFSVSEFVLKYIDELKVKCVKCIHTSTALLPVVTLVKSIILKHILSYAIELSNAELVQT